jgi:hypothetical protein
MALFLIEREFAEEITGQSEDDLRTLVEYNADHDLRWLFSFLSADKRKSYCLYEAPDPEALRKQAEDLGVPADRIIEVSEMSEAVTMTGDSVTGFPAA